MLRDYFREEEKDTLAITSARVSFEGN